MAVQNDPIASLIKHWRARQAKTVATAGSITASGSVDLQVIRPTGIRSEEQVGTPRVINYPDVLLQASIVTFGDKTKEGQLIQGVSVAWFEIIKQLEQDPDFLFRIEWRKLEEVIAGAYERAGWPEVILTPRSGDHGRDIIATKPGIGSVRIIDQVKAYARGHRVTADEVRSVLGVLAVDPNVSKGVITTSSEFAPGIFEDPGLKAFMPYRLELKDGYQLRHWLIELTSEDPEAR
jgi:restriction system protein